MLTSHSLPRIWLICGALAAGTGTIMGALAAHLPDTAFGAGGRAMAHSAMDMQMWHGIALVALGQGTATRRNRLVLAGGTGLLVGMLLFCGGVYYTAFTGLRINHLAPTGGSLIILSWLALAAGWIRRA
ncbi:DUF423 domain-containing protein [Acetobacter garciniae]|nr:DUF423 domain-containing protein [Acetobacter garciniae]